MPRKSKSSISESSNVISDLQKRLTFNRNQLLIGLLVVVVLVLIYYFKGVFVAALVNGKPITRIEVVRELEKNSGQEVLESLISKTLILQEAGRRNIMVQEKEIDTEMKKIEKAVSGQGQSFDEALKAQNITRQDLRERLKVELLVEKLVKDRVKVTEAQIDDFLRTNEETLPENLSEEELRQGAKQQLESQELNQAAQKLLADLKQKAKIKYFVLY